MRNRTILTVIAVGALAALAGGVALLREGARDSADRPATDVRVPPEYYGVDGTMLRLMLAAGKDATLDRQLDSIARLPISFVRSNLDWIKLEPAPPVAGRHTYVFAAHDEWVTELARHRLRWYVIGVGTPAWAAQPAASAAGCGIKGPPARPEDFAALMATIAGRYGRAGSFWSEHPELPYRPVIDYELWNEANSAGAWCPAPDPAAYAALVAASSAAIRAVDPRARIVLGGLAPFVDTAPVAPGTLARTAVPEFLEGVLTARPDLEALIDVVGVHAYGEPDAVLGQLRWYRRTLAELGLVDVPLSLNETGWTTSGQGSFVPVSEAQRAAYLQQVTAAVARSDCGVTSFAPHTWATDEQDPADQEQWFGIADPRTGAPYPSALAYAQAARTLPPGANVPADETDPICGD